MDVMATDRKVWTTHETRALITLKEEMKPKFQTMKRNRPLWIELSTKLRKHFGHERTASQCAVRWKNIMSSYKDSRDALKNPSPDRKVCSFFKEVEALLGDPPLEIPGVATTCGPDHMRLDDIQSEAQPATAVHTVDADAAGINVPSAANSFSASRNSRRADIVTLISEIRSTAEAQYTELRADIQAQTQKLNHLEKSLLRIENLLQHDRDLQNGEANVDNEQHERPADAHASVFNMESSHNAGVTSHAVVNQSVGMNGNSGGSEAHPVVASHCESIVKANLDAEMSTGEDDVEEEGVTQGNQVDMHVEQQQTDLHGDPQQSHMHHTGAQASHIAQGISIDPSSIGLNSGGVGEGCTQQGDGQQGDVQQNVTGAADDDGNTTEIGGGRDVEQNGSGMMGDCGESPVVDGVRTTEVEADGTDDIELSGADGEGDANDGIGPDGEEPNTKRPRLEIELGQ